MRPLAGASRLEHPQTGVFSSGRRFSGPLSGDGRNISHAGAGCGRRCHRGADSVRKVTTRSRSGATPPIGAGDASSTRNRTRKRAADARRREAEAIAAQRATLTAAAEAAAQEEAKRRREEAKSQDEAEYKSLLAAGGAVAANARWERLNDEAYDKYGGRYGSCQWEYEDDSGESPGVDARDARPPTCIAVVTTGCSIESPSAGAENGRRAFRSDEGRRGKHV